MASATTRSWSLVCAFWRKPIYLIPENSQGAARAKGQTAPTSEGGVGANVREREFAKEDGDEQGAFMNGVLDVVVA